MIFNSNGFQYESRPGLDPLLQVISLQQRISNSIVFDFAGSVMVMIELRATILTVSPGHL